MTLWPPDSSVQLTGPQPPGPWLAGGKERGPFRRLGAPSLSVRQGAWLPISTGAEAGHRVPRRQHCLRPSSPGLEGASDARWTEPSACTLALSSVYGRGRANSSRGRRPSARPCASPSGLPALVHTRALTAPQYPRSLRVLQVCPTQRF